VRLVGYLKRDFTVTQNNRLTFLSSPICSRNVVSTWMCDL